MENYESQHTEEYFQIVYRELNTLLENIKKVPLEDADYQVLSSRATSEVSSYIRSSLIKPLLEARARIGMEVETSDGKTTPEESPSVDRGKMQKILLFSNPLQEIFAAFKEVPYLNQTHYDKLIMKHSDAPETLTDFIDTLEKGRKDRLGK